MFGTDGDLVATSGRVVQRQPPNDRGIRCIRYGDWGGGAEEGGMGITWRSTGSRYIAPAPRPSASDTERLAAGPGSPPMTTRAAFDGSLPSNQELSLAGH